jgi:hypothetical protein
MIVYLWDTGRWCGIRDSLEDAMEDAGNRMAPDAWAWVEEARPADAVRSLMRTYERTGRMWAAQGCVPGGKPEWWLTSSRPDVRT